jgi:hypothetical protein
MGGVVHPLPLYTFMVCIGTNLYLIHFTLLGIDPENIVYVEFGNQRTVIIPKHQ